MTSGNRTTGNSMKATDGTASAIQVTYNISGGLLGGVQATNSNMYGTHTIGTGGLNMWKQAYGYDLDAAKTTRGWNETLVLGVGGLVAPGTGFQANSSYTMSSVFTISGLANVATWGTNSPVNLTGTGINVKNIYLAGSNGQVVDLLHISGGSLATLLSSGTFMLTWQFETNSSFNPSSSVTMDFSDSLLSLAGDYGMSALAVRDGMPSLAVPLLFRRFRIHEILPFGIIHQVGRNFTQEGGTLAGHAVPVAQARGAIGQHEFFLGARDAHVKQAAFFVTVAVFQGTLVRQDAFFQPHEVHHREFQPLGGVHGNQAHAGLVLHVVVIVLLVQSDLGQIVPEGFSGLPEVAEGGFHVPDGYQPLLDFCLRLAQARDVLAESGFFNELFQGVSKNRSPYPGKGRCIWQSGR